MANKGIIMNDYQNHSQEAEQCVLGSLLFAPERFIDVIEVISEDDFFTYPHKIIFRAMCFLDDKKQPIDVSTVIQTLSTMNQLSEVGGIGYLAQLANDVARPANVLAYAKVMSDKSKERAVITIAKAMQDEITESEEDTETKVNNALSMPLAIESKESVEKTTIDFMRQSIENLEFRHNMDGKITGLKTEFNLLDNRFQGLQSGQLMILAARPAMGKTTLALNFAANAALNGQPGATLFFSLEMSGKELMDKLICSIGGIDYTLFKQGFPKGNPLCDAEWSKVSYATGKLKACKSLIVDDRAGITFQQLRAKAIRTKRKYGSIKVLFVDYLTLIRTPDKGNRVLEVGALSRGLKNLSKELECPIVCLAQLSRKVEDRADKKPLMSDLRDSGEIEQDADIISFIYRDSAYNPNSLNPFYTEIITVKNRAGETGTDGILSELKQSRFSNLPNDYYFKTEAVEQQSKPQIKRIR